MSERMGGKEFPIPSIKEKAQTKKQKNCADYGSFAEQQDGQSRMKISVGYPSGIMC